MKKILNEDIKKNLFQRIFNITPKLKVKINRKNIICYKLFEETEIPGIIKSTSNNLYLINIPQKERTICIWSRDNYGVNIKGGYSSFISLPSLYRFIQHKKITNYSIYECIIPKNSEFLVCNTLFSQDTYISNHLKIIKKVGVCGDLKH